MQPEPNPETGVHAAQARLLEHNVRFGDPECQCLMTRLQSDLLEVLLAAAEGHLGDAQLQWSPQKALTVRCPQPLIGDALAKCSVTKACSVARGCYSTCLPQQILASSLIVTL